MTGGIYILSLPAGSSGTLSHFISGIETKNLMLWLLTMHCVGTHFKLQILILSFYFEIFFSKQVVIPLVVSLVQLVDSRIHFVVGKIKKTEKMD